MTHLQLTNAQVRVLLLPVRGSGGYQNFMRKLRKQLTLNLSTKDVARIQRYADGYGEGGFQGRLRRLMR
jgi:hypothetical protein